MFTRRKIGHHIARDLSLDMTITTFDTETLMNCSMNEMYNDDRGRLEDYVMNQTHIKQFVL